MTDAATDLELLDALLGADPEELRRIVDSLPGDAIQPLLGMLGGTAPELIPTTPLGQAQELDERYLPRPHLEYLSERIAAAVADVERGISRRLIVSMPPRMGKSALTSVFTPVWLLRKHPDWKLMLASHSPDLAASWGREVRRIVERNPELGVTIAPDAKAVTRWETTKGGIVRSLSVGQSPTGEGAKVLLIDDPTRDFQAAHSEPARNALWTWWQADISTRLEGATLVVATATRWHEADLLGRLLSHEYDGDPAEWEQIIFPAIATEADAIGRKPGDPLLSPLVPDETRDQAIKRFAGIRRGMSSYQWSALYDQSPSPAQGAIFDVDWWQYWTRNPARATADGRVIYLDDDTLAGARVITSWDAAFKGTESSDFVVGQRWALVKADRCLLDQTRDRRSFTETVAEIRRFAVEGFGASRARQHLIEDKANGPAIIDTLRREIAGLKSVSPQGSKEARARAVTPEIESGNVRLPLPDEAPWVNDLLDEARVFPNGKHDDSVDALTQALSELREPGAATLHPPSTLAAKRAPAGFRGALRGF